MEERHRLLLIKQNPWWKKEHITLPSFERDLHKELLKFMTHKQILAIVGLRRVGKTIIMKQLIQKLKAKENNICYISFDDIDFQTYTIAEDLINYFFEFSDKNNRRYLFLDEIQKLPNWPDLLKTIYDLEENIKIIVSGSSRLDLQQYKETLAGRILTFYLPVLTFTEFLRYHTMPHTLTSKNIIHEYDVIFAEKKERYKELFEIYLIKGAFPELLNVDIQEKEFIKKYIKESIIEKAIVDIARITKEDEKIIYELFRLLSNSTARLFEITNLANILTVNRNRISRCISLLEQAFLLKITYNFTASVAKQVRANKKQYAAHSCIVITLLDYPFEVVSTELAGHLIEGIIVNAVDHAAFWRTPQKDEVDIVVKGKKILPIEVKYQTQIASDDVKTILKFSKKFRCTNGIVVTKTMLESKTIDGINILFIPAWFFLLYWDSQSKE
ncbi:MAG: ATP-binding protein [Candidatus Thermoplasmatota archaeon]